MKTRNAFTLVEIMIVVVILGILAAVVVAQFAPVRSEASTAKVTTDLRTVRTAIEYYKVQHSDALPGAGAASFVDALSAQTDVSGNAGTDFGPYLQKMPLNPFNELDTIQVESGVSGLGGGDYGWHFDTATGAFNADTNGQVAL